MSDTIASSRASVVANAMGKKFRWLLLIFVLLLLTAFLVYRRMTHVSPPRTPVVSQWPTSLPPASAPSAPVTPPPATKPANPTAPPALAEKKAPPPAPAFVLKPGETLEFDASVPALNSTIAHLKISALEKRSSPGTGAWHLQAIAHTENPYRMVFQLDDQFDSYADAANMTSVQYELHLSERGQKVDTIERMLTSMQDPIPSTGTGVRVPPGTRDPIGMLEYLRGVDWSLTPQVHSPVFDGHKLYDVRVALVGKASNIKVPAGTFNANKIEIHVLENGQEMKDAHFLLYLTNDTARLPVLLEAVLPVTTARVELTKATP